MALPDILEKIEAEAMAEAEKIRAQGTAKATEVIAEAEAKVRTHDEREQKLCRAKSNAAAETVVVAARVAARDAVLEVRREMIDRAFAAAAEAVSALDDEAWLTVFVPRIVAAARSNETVMLGSEDGARAKALTAALARIDSTDGVRLTLSTDAAAFTRGVYLTGEKTSVSLSAVEVIEGERRVLERDVAAILAGEST
ncbi:MAG: V-type ATP synthase subunit E family protein [Coriobacteriia bacterium]|nr:V-type ATP synthase subunit E family protein [Coriobacteriia bacterium]